MFVFGNPEDIARTAVESASEPHGGIIDLPLDEQTEQQVTHTLVILRMALRMARTTGADEDTVSIIADWHDEALQALAGFSEKVRKSLISGTYLQTARIKDAEVKAYYKRLGEEA